MPSCLHEGECGSAEEKSATLWSERFFCFTKGTNAAVSCICFFANFPTVGLVRVVFVIFFLNHFSFLQQHFFKKSLVFFQIEEDEKLKKRKERFGALTSASSATSADVEVCFLYTCSLPHFTLCLSFCVLSFCYNVAAIYKTAVVKWVWVSDIILSLFFTGKKKEACWEICNCMIFFFF